MTKQDEPIFPDDPRAAQRATLSGWLSRTGHFYPDTGRYLEGADAEFLARNDGATHWRCKVCGEPTHRYFGKCFQCMRDADAEAFRAKDPETWDGTWPLCLFHDDTFFWGWDDVEDYCADHGCEPDDLLLHPCRPDHGPTVDDSIFEDHLPDCDPYAIPDEVHRAIEALNKTIHKHGPYSWCAITSRRVQLPAVSTASTDSP